jgi:hypothetical protein
MNKTCRILVDIAGMTQNREEKNIYYIYCEELWVAI